MESIRRLAIARENARTTTIGSLAVEATEDPQTEERENSPVTAELVAIRELVTKLRGALLEPSIVASSTAIEECLPALQAAADRLQTVAQLIEGGALDHCTPFSDDRKSRVSCELAALREELLRAEALRRNGAEFWSSWARLLGMELGRDTGDSTLYTADGKTTVPPGWSVHTGSGRIQVEG